MVTMVEKQQMIPQILDQAPLAAEHDSDHEEGEISDDDDDDDERDRDRIGSSSAACSSGSNAPFANKFMVIETTRNSAKTGQVQAAGDGKQQTRTENSLQTVENHINKVTVGNACKSVIDACGELHDALLILHALPSDDHQQPVSSLVSKIVDRIRIVYCVYNATGDDQKPQVLHSLTKLASLYTDKLFTPVQLQELSSLLQALKGPEEIQTNRLTEYVYLPWDGDVVEKQPVASSGDPLTSYGTYMSASFPMDDFPSPTPSAEDEAARYGKSVIPGVSLPPRSSDDLQVLEIKDRKRSPPSSPEGAAASKETKRSKLADRSPGNEGWLDLNAKPGELSDQKPDEQALTNGEVINHDIHPELLEILSGLDEAERDEIIKERQRRMDEQEKMLSAKKLCLVLDLDHTLLNSAKFNEIEPEWEQYLRTAETIERAKDGKGPRRELYRSTYMSMWTKLRPGIWRFLARASQLYELHLYTMGNKAYATEMAKLLDPTGLLFAGRVISKGDDGEALYGDEKIAKSKDLDGVLGMESGVLIVDDSTRVWPHHRDNLVVVERYMYFPCSRRQFGLPGPSLLELGHDEREADGMLASILGVIEQVHAQFYLGPHPRESDVRGILSLVQRSILGGCKIIFSRIIPVTELQPQLHPLWRMAEQFGAICTTRMEEDVTHVVANSMGTDKVNWALATGRHLVRPAWVEASTVLYRRANERDFPVPP